MKDKIIWGLVCVAVGFVACLFLMPKQPDIRTVIEYKVVTKTVQVNKNTVTDREIIKYKDGTEKIVERIVDRDVIKEKEIIKDKIIDKTINYSGSAFVLWDSLNIQPSDVGISYTIINPISAVLQYDLFYKKIKVGVMLQF